jgi:DHA1 family multidrug resistance protein-like MFS transporter
LTAPDPSVAGSTPAADQKAGFRVIVADPAVRVVILIIFVIMLGFGIIAPILPLFARSFGVGYETASLLISAFAFARLIFDPIAGPIVDRFGERITSMAGVVIVGVSAFLAGLAPNFALAVLFRGAGGAGSSILFAALFSYLLKVVPSERMARTMSVFFGALNVGIIAGGPIGGFIAYRYDLNTPLFVYSGLCFAAGVLYLKFMKDPQPKPLTADEAAEDSPVLEGPMWWRTWVQVRALLRERGFVTAIMLNMAFFWVVAGGYDTLVPLFGREALGMTTVAIGGVFAIAVVAEFLVLYPAGSVADRVGRKPVMLVSLSGLAIMIVAVGWAGSPVALGVLMGMLGLTSGSAAATPSAMLSDVVPDRGSGTAVGVFRFAGDLGFVFGPLVAGISVGVLGFRGAFAVMALPVLVALAMAVRTPETLRRASADR